MRQAIVTKYLGPTNHRGSRIKATAEAGSIVVPWNYALDPQENHRMAALTLASNMGWDGGASYRRLTACWHGGALPGGGYAFVFVEGE
jgi:hypothetical protein